MTAPTLTRPAGTPDGPEPRNDNDPPKTVRLRTVLISLAATAAVTAIVTTSVNGALAGAWTQLSDWINPPHADVRFTVYAPPTGVHVGDRPVERFEVENDGNRTAAECSIRWTPGPGMHVVAANYFSLRAGHEFPVSLPPTQAFPTAGVARGSVTLRCADGAHASEPVHTVVAPRSGSAASQPTTPRLDSIAPCENAAPSSALGKQLSAAGEALVDGRCDSAINLNKAVGIYGAATQATGGAIAAASTGTVLHVLCSVVGQPRQNVRADSSSLWLHIQIAGKQGYIPAIWTQHGTVRPC